jgi:hypothetical protein
VRLRERFARQVVFPCSQCGFGMNSTGFQYGVSESCRHPSGSGAAYPFPQSPSISETFSSSSMRPASQRGRLIELLDRACGGQAQAIEPVRPNLSRVGLADVQGLTVRAQVDSIRYAHFGLAVSTWPVPKIRDAFDSVELMKIAASRVGMFAPQARWVSVPKTPSLLI